ncbi:MAG: hypothetical protein ABIQ13_14570 [Pedococcus sp.]
MNSHAAHRSSALHHPRVQRSSLGGWAWACSCGGASCRTSRDVTPWRVALIGALNHSSAVAP